MEDAAGEPPPPPQATKTAADKLSKAAPKSLRFMEIPLNSVEKIEKTPKSAKAHICRTTSNDTRKQAARKEIVISAGVAAVLLHICNFSGAEMHMLNQLKRGGNIGLLGSRAVPPPLIWVVKSKLDTTD